MSEILDLDTIMPKAITIKLGGKDLIVEPPTVAQVLVLIQLNTDLMDADDHDADAKYQAMVKVQDHLRLMIPGLPDGIFSAYVQRALIELIMDLAKPDEEEELAKKGITVDSSKKA